MKRANTNDASNEDEMRLWDQIFANALATSNTSQWMHLRQIFGELWFQILIAVITLKY